MTDITVTNIKAAADWIGATALEPLANVTKYEEPTVCEKEHAWVYSPGLFKPISARRLKKLLESVPPLFDFGDFYVAFFPDWERPNPYDYPTWFIDFLAVYKKHMPRSYDPEPGLCKGVTLWRYATTPIFGAQMEMARRPIRGSFITKETKVPVGHIVKLCRINFSEEEWELLRTLHSGEEVPTGGIDDEYAVIYTSLATPEQNMFLLTHGYWGEDFAQRHERDLRRVLGDLYEGSKWDVDQQ